MTHCERNNQYLQFIFSIAQKTEVETEYIVGINNSKSFVNILNRILSQFFIILRKYIYHEKNKFNIYYGKPFIDRFIKWVIYSIS